MKRINIIGTSGSGKSTFAKKLAKKLKYPYIEMDRIFWGPEWYWPPDEEFFINLESALECEHWVLDGNYTRTIHIKWREVTTVIWIDLPFLTTFFQAVRRAVKRSISGEEIWPGTNNRENFLKSFFSRDSIILWTITSYRRVRRKCLTYMKDERFSHIKFLRFRSHKDAEKFLNSL